MATGRLITWGWIMFAFSGVCFLIPAVRDADWWSLGAAVTWLVGVGLFLAGSRPSDADA